MSMSLLKIFTSLLILSIFGCGDATRFFYNFHLFCQQPGYDVARVEFHKLGYQNRSAYYGEYRLYHGQTRFSAVFDAFNYQGPQNRYFDIRGSLQYNCGGSNATVELTSTVPVHLREYTHTTELNLMPNRK
ncbi:unnamed protein product [Caenorhabditis angaria]|uniref:Lipoprotein n=1 Tax=Caenorhabditis angaria TaxID=860376 RepID=A0A9P1IG62_9PELO|nr:unnamed protein product [Caenorhabditis angaria]